MEELNFVLLWKEQYEKIDASLAINKKLLIKSINRDAKSALYALKKTKAVGIIILVPYLIILGLILFFAISNYSSGKLYFIVSFACIFLINLKALFDYIKHLIMVNSIDYNGSVTEIQQQLAKLQVSVINHSGIMYLQFPFWTTFCLSSNWFPQNVGWAYIVFQLLLTGAFTYFAIWIYKKHTIANLDKKWFQRFIAGSGEKSISEAMEFYKELEAFKQE